jgi:hypothetical protein
MSNAPMLEKAILDATVLGISESNPALVSTIERLVLEQDREKLRYNNRSTLYRIEFATHTAENVLVALKKYAREFENPALVLLNGASLEQLIQRWTRVVAGLKEIRGPFDRD